MDILERCAQIKSILEDKKAEGVEVFDERQSGYFVDAVVIATTVAAKHAAMLVDELKKWGREHKESLLNVDESDEWTIVDFGDVLVHLMSSEYRKRYDLEDFLRAFAAQKGE